MKLKFPSSAAIVVLTLSLPAVADVIYSNSLNTSIPLDFTGVTINVGSGSINPFFGGVGVANDVALQPFRAGTGGSDTILNFTAGDVINSSTATLASPGGFGGSTDHVGGAFTAGAEGYVGFKLNGANYGWMRVVFTNNTGGAVVKDWAYEDSGAAASIGVGNITTTGSVVTADSSDGDFTVASVLTDAGGAKSFVKSGTGTVSLKATSTYTGATSVNAGNLVVNGNISTSSLTTVNGAATLSGTGVTGAMAIASAGTLAPGVGGIESLDVNGDLTLASGSFSNFEINTAGDISDLVISNAAITFGGTLTVNNIGSALMNGDIFNLFDWSSTNGTFSTVSLPILTGSLIWDQSMLYTNGTIAVIPEPSIALLGGLSLLGLALRRRR
jgi:autotransporter-associated beta strand protein